MAFGRSEFICKVIDDWNRSEYFVDKFNNHIFRNEIPFSFSPSAVDTDYQFSFLSHPILGRDDNNPRYPIMHSHLYVLTLQFLTLLANDYQIDFNGVGRSNLNIVYPTNKPTPQCNFHVDHPYTHLSVLLYLNDTDGDTLLSDQFFNSLYDTPFRNNCNLNDNIEDDDKVTILERVSPKKGRILIFNGENYHTSMCPTEKERAVLVSTLF